MTVFYIILLLFGACSAQDYSFTPSIVRPCPSMDLNCVRSFSARHSSCTLAFAMPDAEWTVSGVPPMPLPHANLTFIWENPRIQGLGDPKVQEFYVNTNTKKVVLMLWYRHMNTYSPALTLKYYLKGREPVQLTDYFSIAYDNFYVTATIPFDSVNGIRWNERDVYVYFQEPRMPYTHGNGLVNEDPEIQAAFNELLKSQSNVNLGVKEASVVKGPLIFDLYFKNYVCRY